MFVQIDGEYFAPWHCMLGSIVRVLTSASVAPRTLRSDGFVFKLERAIA